MIGRCSGYTLSSLSDVYVRTLTLAPKLELKLRKKDNRSWTLLEKTDRDLGNINFTFGVGGRTGTIGAKELVLDDANKART